MENGKPRVIKLANGMRLVTVDMPGINSVTVLAMVGVGSRYERPGVAGISHFLEHMPFKGTLKYPDSMAIATAIDGVGGKHNAFTGKDVTGYWVKVASGHLELALDIVSDLLLAPKLEAAEIEKERGVIIEEINMYEDQPQAKVEDVFEELVFAGSPLARPVIGVKRTVAKLGRKDFLDHYNAFYNPENVVIGIVGKIRNTKYEIRKKAEEYFGKGEGRAGGGEKVFGVPEQTEPRVKVVYKKTEQAHFHLGFPAFGFADPRRYQLAVLATILGGNTSSRLFNEIREKRGLAYYALAAIEMAKEAGCLRAVEGVALDKAAEAVKVTLAEFEKLRVGEGLTDEELERAKEYLVGKLSLDMEDSAKLADMMVKRLILEGEVQTLELLVAKVRAVNKEQVLALASQVLAPSRLNLALIGPYRNQAEFERLVKG